LSSLKIQTTNTFPHYLFDMHACAAAALRLLAVVSVLTFADCQTVSYGMPIDGTRQSGNPTYNSVGSRFLARRTYYSDGASSISSRLPNARNVSNAIFGTGPFRYNTYKVAAMTAAWGQFIAHDLIMTTPHSEDPGDIVPVAIPQCDVDMDAACTGTQELDFHRNLYDTSTGGPNMTEPRRQLNMQVSS
jgi:hypothetical protein